LLHQPPDTPFHSIPEVDIVEQAFASVIIRCEIRQVVLSQVIKKFGDQAVVIDIVRVGAVKGFILLLYAYYVQVLKQGIRWPCN